MSNEDIIRIACEAGWDVQDLDDGFGVRLKRFAQALERQPLKDEEIINHFHANVDTGSLLSFADGVRYAEAAHGIKENT